MSNVPTNLIPTRITGLPEYTGTSTLGYMAYVLDGRTYKVQFSNIAAVGAVPSTRVIGTGNGLQGGGDLSQNRVISIIPHGVGYSQLDFTGVTAGTYGSADTIPSLTIDATGRVTAAVNTPVVLSNYVPSSRTVTAGAGLTGGGQLNSNITIALNPSNATPQSLGAAFAGTGTQAARDDHVHPAVDLTDTSETQGVLPLGRGGTGVALSPVVGAVIYADNDSLNQTIAGNAGQILKSAGGLGAPYWADLLAGGTVTSVSVTSANGFAGTVANPTSTPAITLSTTVTGVIKGDGTAISAATPAVDYVAPGAVTTSGLTMATNRLLGRTTASTGAVEQITVGTGLSLSAGSLINSAPDQVVSLTGAGTTVVTGTYPTFTITSNDAFVGTVTSVSGTGTVSGLTLTGTVTSSGSLTLGGTLAVLPSNFASQTANTVLAAPNGSAGVPTFRAIVAADIPTLNQNTTGTASNVTGIVAVANGGTGASVAGTARTNLLAAGSGANTDITSIALTTGTISTSPVSGTDIVNKLYADSIASGINFHQSVRLATAAALPANTYNNGASGVGATLTANANGALSVDGVAVVAGNRILVKNEVTQANNGVYTVTQIGSGAAPYILTRATDFDSAGTGVDQIDAGDFFLVTAGSTQSNTSWVQQTPLPITVGTTAIVFTQFAAPVLYSAGTGLTLAGTVFSITNTGVTASTYGSASSVPVLAINAQGQVTSASASSIAIAASQITSGTVTVAQGGTGATSLTSGYLVKGNGTSAVSASVVYDDGTNVGIGTSSPATLLHISGDSSPVVLNQNTVGSVAAFTALGVTYGASFGVNASGTYITSAANTVFSVSGSETMRIDSSGNVGIGTNSPSNKLDVFGTSTTIMRSYSTGTASSTYAGVHAGTGEGVNSVMYSYQSAGWYGTTSNHPMLFMTNNSERMRLDTSGNVGIGTNAPGFKLDVQGSGSITVRSRSTDTSGATVGILRADHGSGSSLQVRAGVGFTNLISTGATDPLIFSANSAEAMRITSAGNVGIGTTSPAQRLHVATTAAPSGTTQSFLRATADVGFGADFGGGIIQGVGPIATISTVSSGTATERLRIDSSGNVGIGTTSPSQKLHVNGNALFGSSVATQYSNVTIAGDAGIQDADPLFNFVNAAGSTRFGYLYHTGSGGNIELNNQQAGAMLFSTNNTERVRITSAGNVGIGTSSPAERLTVNSASSEFAIQWSGPGNEWVLASAANRSYIRNKTASVETLTILNAGNVGIGTSSPDANAKLDVAGTVRSGAGGSDPGTGAAFYFVGSGSFQTVIGGAAFAVNTGANNARTEKMRIDSSGNVGIGTSSPGAKLDVSSSTFNIVASRSTGGYAAFQRIAPAGQWTYDFYTINGVEAARITVTDTNIMAFATGSAAAERMRIDASGNVGIGTSAPGYKLDVNGTGYFNSSVQFFPQDGFRFTSASAVSAMRFGSATTGEGTAEWAYSRSGGFAALSIGSTGSALTEIMRAQSNGNVGIGTTSPGHRLEVVTNTTANVGFRVQNQSTTQFAGSGILCSGPSAAGNQGGVAFYYYNTNAGGTTGAASIAQFSYDGVFQRQLAVYDFNSQFWGFNTNGSERMRIVSDGAVGIGLSTPNASLHISGVRGGNGRLTQISTSAGSATDALNIMASSSSGGSDQWYSWGVTSGNVWRICPGVGLGSSEAFSINSNSRVLVGSATTFDVTVGADLMVTATAGSAAAFKVNATSATQVSFYDSTQSNRVGWIGTSGSSTSYNTTSDRRLKKNIKPVGDVGAKIDQIEVVSHEWTNGTDTVIPYAFIAQDLYEAAPHAVSKGDDGEEVGLEWAVDYSKLVPMLVKEVQSLRARVAQLEGK